MIDAFDLERTIPAGTSLMVDTSVVLAYLTGTEASSPAATQLFDAFLATGRNAIALSMVTVEEILVRPFRRGTAAVATAEGFLRHFAGIRLVEVSYPIAREAARIRAASGLRTPDALIVASALVAEADLLVTNDRRWQPALEGVGLDVRVHVLG